MVTRSTTGGVRLVGVVAMLAVGALCVVAAQAKHPDTKAWPNLFKADLSNAAMDPGSWAFENGLLVAKDHGTLWTKQSYGDFVLDLEFKVTAGANSGVFLRTGDIKDVLSALEIQVHDTTDGTRYGMVGAIYDAKPPSRSMARPVGEWNHFTITCKGSMVSLVFNGDEVIKANLDDWTEARKNPDGTPNKFPVALKNSARRGPIGFQGIHGTAAAPIWFRNLKIKELS
jgi:hypothetical protein